MKHIELLAPAGNLEKCRVALRYGADAVYVGGPEYSLRARADNFTFEQLEQAVGEVHASGKKIYIAINSYIPESEWELFTAYLDRAASLGSDGLILADPGAVRYLRKRWPGCELHISTQANTVNSGTVSLWAEMGIRRVVLARELSLDDIAAIHRKIPEVELEVFAHGAMCVAYSGRCLLSNYMTHRGWRNGPEGEFGAARSANRGDCSHTCRWSYSLVEEKRGTVELLADEIPGGTMLFSSKDLCMIDHLEDLQQAGVASLKIEGRMKSLLYTAVAVRVYRDALSYLERGETPAPARKAQWLYELQQVSRREFSTGFFYNENRALLQSAYQPEKEMVFAGQILEKIPAGYICRASNKIERNEDLEIIGPDMTGTRSFRYDIMDADGNEIDFVRHGTQFILQTDAEAGAGDIIRMYKSLE